MMTDRTHARTQRARTCCINLVIATSQSVRQTVRLQYTEPKNNTLQNTNIPSSGHHSQCEVTSLGYQLCRHKSARIADTHDAAHTHVDLVIADGLIRVAAAATTTSTSSATARTTIECSECRRQPVCRCDDNAARTHHTIDINTWCL
jgi:hypothetical protein